MKYARQLIMPSPFSDILPDDVEVFSGLNLPMLKFKKDHIEYEVTDIRPLNETAIHVIESIITQIHEDPKSNEVAFTIPDEVDRSSLELVIDIVLSLHIKVKKRGKYGWSYEGQLIPLSARNDKQHGGNHLIFKLMDKRRNRIIHDCVKEGCCISWIDLVIAIANDRCNSMLHEQLRIEEAHDN